MSMFNGPYRRVTLFAGHYGSGKTSIAVNFALALRRAGFKTAIADLDIVNPYFRTKDSRMMLEQNGITLISSEYANSNVDLPALPAQTYRLVEQRDFHAVFDVGGDDRGALALGRYTPFILEENDFDMIFVTNFYRPLTRTPRGALEVMREIEAAGGIPFTALANNSNLAHLTTCADIEATQPLMEQLSDMTGLPVRFTAADAKIAQGLLLESVFPIQLEKRYYDIQEEI